MAPTFLPLSASRRSKGGEPGNRCPVPIGARRPEPRERVDTKPGAVGPRALTAAFLPIVAAGIAIVTATGVAALINEAWPLSVLLLNVATMIGLGVGIDHSLLTLSRFREARFAGLDAEQAAIEASSHAGGTIALSGAAAAIGFGALLLVPLNEMQSIGVGGMLVVATSVLVAVSFLPAVLAVLGPRVNAGRLGGNPLQAWWRAWWRAWGRVVVARPALVFVVASIPLVALGWQATRLDSSLPRGSWLPRGIESANALGDLERMQRGIRGREHPRLLQVALGAIDVRKFG